MTGTQGRIAVGAIVVAAIVVGLVTLDQLDDSDRPTASPAASLAHAPLATEPLYLDWPATLAAGTYASEFIWNVPVTVTFSVPDGWQSLDDQILRGGVALQFAVIDNLYADPCAMEPLAPKVGPLSGDLAGALAALPGAAGAPSTRTIARRDAAVVELSLAGQCPGRYWIWSSRSEDVRRTDAAGGTDFWAPQANGRIWVLAVDDVRYVIGSWWSSDATPAALDQLQSVIDSISLS